MKIETAIRTAAQKNAKAASAEIGERIEKIEREEQQAAPNYLRFTSAISRIQKSAPTERRPEVVKMTKQAMAAYKAKDYAGAIRLRDEAAAFAQGGAGAAEAATEAKAGSPRPPAATSAPKAKKERAPKAPKAPKPDRSPSALNLAAAYLARCENPKNIKEITEAVLAAGWKTEGKTPGATLNAAIIREIKAKGKESRFAKADRGMFTKGAA